MSDGVDFHCILIILSILSMLPVVWDFELL